MAFSITQAETRTKAEEVCRRMGISRATFFIERKGMVF
jgi:hypothetical protein